MHKKQIDNLFYIDSIEGFNLSMKSYDVKKDMIVTDNPLLANDPITKGYVVDISKFLSQEQGNDIGKNIVLMSNEIEKIFIKKKYKNIFSYLSEKIGIYISIGVMVNTIIEKSLIFKLLLNSISVNKLNFIINKSDYYDHSYPWVFPRFTNVYKYIAEKSFFGDIPFKITELRISEPDNINDTSEKNIILRLTTWPISYILYRLLNSLAFFFQKKKSIFYIKKCETLSETISKLFFKGYKIKALKLPKLEKLELDEHEEKKNIISNDIDFILNKYLGLFSFTKSEIVSQKIIIVDHIFFGLVKLHIDTKIYAKYFSNLKSIKYILTSGFYGPIANQLFYLCNKYKIKLIGFEHGVTAGINKDIGQYAENLESTTCHLLMVSNLAAKKEFYRANLLNEESKNNKVYIIGEAEQKKHINFYKLQRFFMKKRYKIKKKEEVIVHVSGVLYAGNFKNAPSSPVSNYTFEREKNLLTKVYNNINKKVLYKKYPTQRLLYQPCYSKLLNISCNITMVEDTDFRYMRTIADIIVTDSNYSTIGWCVVNETPLVYLMSKTCYPLASKNVEELFKDSFFVIDIDKTDWELRLKNLLETPMKDLKRKWDDKKDQRTFLIEEYIHGPLGNSSTRASNYIDKLL